MENNEVIVKQKSNKGVIVLLVIIIIILLGISGYLAYDKFIAKDKTPMSADQKDTKEDYVGYYSGCSKNLEGDEVCAELVLNEDKTAFLLYDPLGPTAVVGNYSIDKDTIVINSTYKLSEFTPGINYEKYNLKLDGEKVIYNFNNGTVNLVFNLNKTTEDKLNLYNQMKSSLDNKTNDQTNNQTTTETD